jgi:hypothetical protein
MSFMLSKIGEIARSPGDPKVLETGPSSLGWADRSVRNLGWFSFALGATELLAAPQLARWLGMEGKENLIRAYGARELGAGMLCLSTEQAAGAWSRVAGDVLDAATLAPTFRNDNPQKRNVESRSALSRVRSPWTSRRRWRVGSGIHDKAAPRATTAIAAASPRASTLFGAPPRGTCRPTCTRRPRP